LSWHNSAIEAINENLLLLSLLLLLLLLLLQSQHST
jgi:hypothetical protein